MSSVFPLMPLGDRIVVRRDAPEKTTLSGIIIPDTAEQKKKTRGIVVAIGQGRRNDKGELVPMSVSVGDTIMFENDWRDPVEIDGEEFMVLHEENIIGIIK